MFSRQFQPNRLDISHTFDGSRFGIQSAGNLCSVVTLPDSYIYFDMQIGTTYIAILQCVEIASGCVSDVLARIFWSVFVHTSRVPAKATSAAQASSSTFVHNPFHLLVKISMAFTLYASSSIFILFKLISLSVMGNKQAFVATRKYSGSPCGYFYKPGSSNRLCSRLRYRCGVRSFSYGCCTFRCSRC